MSAVPPPQQQRWQRQHVAIRCALYPQQAVLIRIHLGLGRRLVHEGLLPEVSVQQRMLKLLLDTALDEALPWYWRSVCLEHAVAPLSRLQTLAAHQHATWGPAAARVLQARLQEARARLPALPPTHAAR